MLENIFKAAKAASLEVALLSDEKRSEILCKVADRIMEKQDEILKANEEDLSRMEKSNPLYDRLLLTPERLKGISDSMKDVAALPVPTGKILEDRTMPNGLRLRKVTVPFGLIGMIYEARPNVTYDVFALCLRSGNACVLKGGKDADSSNRKGVEIIQEVLREEGLNPSACELLPATHEATGAMLTANGLVDLVIPRGSRRLIDFVRDNAKVPCIETGAGVVNCYVDAESDNEMAAKIVMNAKTRRVSVCNALDCLIINEKKLSELPEICKNLATKNVEIMADEKSYSALEGKYPQELLVKSTPDDYGTEFMAYRMSIKTVQNLDEALEHIRINGSGHSESIVTTNEENAAVFQKKVDAACVYVNAPTSFTDGGEFGLGAEIGISTQKLGARGPMGLCELNTYKWLINGNGQTRK
ncbi:MAG: glutamate-5-semialdehyde dehydrogenase [Bacteroidales bacterium]|nr:glutamate-5-semialdehyde dehydrogenase [Bacteroidales bacterium]